MAQLIMRVGDYGSLAATAFTITDNDGNVVDLTGATTVDIICGNNSTGTGDFDHEVVITTPTSGIITFTPIITDFDTETQFHVQFRVNATGSQITYDWGMIRVLPVMEVP